MQVGQSPYRILSTYRDTILCPSTRDKQMNPELHEIYAYLVSASDRAELIEAADELILAYNRNPKLFVLPKTYQWATPLIEHFAYDLAGWVEFVRQITDEFPKRSEERRPVQQVYRKLNVRHDAAIRRERLRKAVLKYVDVYGEFDSKQDAENYQKWLFQYWTAARRVRLAQLSASGKVSAEERRSVCDEFWGSISKQISEGKLPHIDEVRRLRDEAVNLDSFVSGRTH